MLSIQSTENENGDELLTRDNQWNSKRFNGIAFVTIVVSSRGFQMQKTYVA